MKRQNPLIHLTRTAWAFAENQRARFVVYIAMSVTAMCTTLIEPLVIGRIINAIQNSSSSDSFLHEMIFYLSIYVSLSVVFWILHGPSRVIERDVAFKIRTNYQLGLFRMATALPIKWHKDAHSGETIDKISRAATALNEFCESSFEILHIISRFLGSMLVLCFFLPVAGLAVSGATVGVIFTIILFDRILFEQYETLNGFYHKVASAIHDYLTNIRTVISLRLEDRVAGEVNKRIQNAFPLFKKNIVLNEVKWFITSVIVSLVIAGVLIGYCITVLQSGESLQAGTFFTLFEYLRRIGDGFFGFAWKYGNLVTYSARVVSAESIIQAYARDVAPAAQATLPRDWQQIDISHLTFAHNNSTDVAARLEDISLCLKRGSSIALVGESGSGKSTVLSLLRALHKADRVEVRCDGVTLPNELLHVAHHTTLIPQDPEIFAETIRFNVSMGIEATDEELLQSIHQARFDSVLARLTKGLDTSIAEKGVNLSGGEKQRLALARGFFFARASDIILLDEPTSSVDLMNERVIYQSILDMFRDRCVISSIHKLYLLPSFDQIYVFQDGKVVESGGFHDLLDKKGALAAMWAKYSLEENV